VPAAVPVPAGDIDNEADDARPSLSIFSSSLRAASMQSVASQMQESLVAAVEVMMPDDVL